MKYYVIAFLWCSLLFTIVWYGLKQSDYDLNWTGLWDYRSNFLAGLRLTVLISISALCLSIFLSVALLGIQKYSESLAILIAMYTVLIRSTPFLVQILIWYYVIFPLIGLSASVLSGIIIISLFSSVYIAEIFRAGIQGISQSQLDIADAIGFKSYQRYRYVIFPQMIRKILPPLTGQLINLVKDSSLLSVIGIAELTRSAQEVSSFTFSTLESYLLLAGCYMILALPLVLLATYLEKRFHFQS